MTELFLKLLSMSLPAGCMIVAVALLRLALKRAPKWISCLLWALVAVRLVCPFSFESRLSLIPSADVPAALETVAGQFENWSGQNVQNVPGTEVPAVSAVPEVIPPAANAAGTNASAAVPAVGLAEIAAAVWLAGAAVMLLYALISWLRLRRRVSAAMSVGEGVWICDEAASPFILGLFRPRIYLPSALAPENTKHVLAHERAHLSRRDHWWKAVGYVLLAVYWFQPLCWLAYALLCRDIELACDEKVVKRPGVDRKAYSNALLACAVKRSGITVCPLAFGEVSVRSRVKSVLNYRKPAFWIILAALLACAVLAVCFLTDPMKEEEKPLEEAPAVSDAGNVGADDAASGEKEEDEPGEPLTVTEDPMSYEERLARAQSGEVYKVTYADGGSSDVVALDWREENGTLAFLWQYYGSPHPGICNLSICFADGTLADLPLPETQTNRTAQPASMEFSEGKFLYNVDVSTGDAAATYRCQVDLAEKAILVAVEGVPDEADASAALAQVIETLKAERTAAALTLTIDGDTTVAAYDAWSAVNTLSTLNGILQFSFEDAPVDDELLKNGTKVTLQSETLAGVSIDFYAGTDYVVLHRNGEDYYLVGVPAEEDIFLSPLGDFVRRLYDEAEYAALDGYDGASIVVTDAGQDYLAAAQEWCEKYDFIHLLASSGSKKRYTYVLSTVEPAESQTEHSRQKGEIGENTYAFWVTTVFVPENEAALQWSMAGNTGSYTGSDPDVPDGAMEYTSCGYITLEEDGWHGKITGTGF